MSHILTVVSFILFAVCLKFAVDQDRTIKEQAEYIESLQKDSVLMHSFFQEQSIKHDSFYVDWLRHKDNLIITKTK